MTVSEVPSCRTKPKRNTVTLSVVSKTLCSPIQWGLQIAREQEEDTGGFHVFPVTERPVNEQVVRAHSAIPFKTLKELK